MIAAAPDLLLLLVGGGQYDSVAFLESWIFMILALPLMRQLSRRIMGSFGMWWRLPTALVGKIARVQARCIQPLRIRSR